MNTAAVSVGSNIEPHANIRKARDIIAREQARLEQARQIQTDPIGFADQPPFINTAFLVRTVLSRRAFERYLKEVENRLGRQRSQNRYGPRTIDLDLIVWNGMVVDNDYRDRDFVRTLVWEIWPHMKDAR